MELTQMPFTDFGLWKETDRLTNTLLTLNLELTARCNNDCRHCYINQPADDRSAKALELDAGQILALADEAVELGCLWCLITGGEPLLREDFEEIYMGLKRRGLLVSVFTNATLLTADHARLFRHYPPRDLDITVYGLTEPVYGRVTRRTHNLARFYQGLEHLLAESVAFNLKAVITRSCLPELEAIKSFCQLHSTRPFRRDIQLHLRHDRDEVRNGEIQAEMLSEMQMARIEMNDGDRDHRLDGVCRADNGQSGQETDSQELFTCHAGLNEVTIGSDGRLRLCTSLVAPEMTASLRGKPLEATWQELIERVRGISEGSGELDRCRQCELINLCQQCPAHASLETGRPGAWVERFCREAHARAGKRYERKLKGNRVKV